MGQGSGRKAALHGENVPTQLQSIGSMKSCLGLTDSAEGTWWDRRPIRQTRGPCPYFSSSHCYANWSMQMGKSCHSAYTGWSKNGYPHFYLQLRQMLTDFHNSFTGRLLCKFLTKSTLNIPLYVTNVATPYCEISEFKKCRILGLNK